MIEQNYFFQAAEVEFTNKKYKKSFLYLIQLSGKYSNDLKFLRLLADVQTALSDWKALIKTREVIYKNTQAISDALLLIDILIAQEQRNIALDYSLQLTDMSLSNSDKIKLNCNLLKIYSLENDFDGLKEVCDQLQELGYTGADLSYSQALLASAKGLIDEASQYLRYSIEQDKNFDQSWAALGLVHSKKGDFELARANMAKALDVNPNNKIALKYLAAWSIKPDEMNYALEKTQYHLRNYCFDEDVSNYQIHLLNQLGEKELMQFESAKLSYYFGKPISL